MSSTKLPGCFSWCIPRRNSSDPKALTVAIRTRDVEKKGARPTSEMYLLEATKATSATLKELSKLVPLPLVADFLDLATRIVEACETATTLEENIEELRKRVVSLSVLIFEQSRSDDNVPHDFQTRIKNLQLTLTGIVDDLEEIKRQWRWLLVLFPQLNKSRVDRCVVHLDVALESFNMSQHLHVDQVLTKILQKSTEIDDKIAGVNDNISGLRKEMQEYFKPHSAPNVVGRQDIPPQPKVFYGREGDVVHILGLLSDKDTSRVCITGPGGMGKTRLALTLIHHLTVHQIFGDYRFWVPCIKATSADGLRRTLYTQLSITAQSYDSLDILIAELKATEDRRLILLDNFETPWHSTTPEDQADINDILSRIADIPHVALVVTMTSSFPPDSHIPWQHHQLPALGASAARQAFLEEYPEASSADLTELDKLTNAVGCIPLALYLLAVNGKRSQTSVKDLLEEWKSTGTGMIDQMDRRIQKSVELVRSEDTSNEALKLLAVLSMLPVGTTRRNLGLWAADMRSLSSAFALLRNKALVEHEDQDLGDLSHIYIRPTFQAYMDKHELISNDVQRQVRNSCYEFVLKHKSTPDDARFKEDLSILSREENNIHVLLTKEDDNPDSLRAGALVAFSFYLYETKQSIVIADLALKVAEAGLNHRCIAESHEILGKMYRKLSEYDKACHHFEEAHRCFVDLPTGADLARAGECSFQLADVWTYMQRPSGELLSLVNRGRNELSHDEHNRYNIARALLGFGYYLWYSLGSQEEIVKTLTAATDEFEKLGCPASASESLHSLARAESQSGTYPLALKLSRQAVATAEQSGDGYLIAKALLTEACCLIVLKSYNDAECVLQKCLLQARSLGHILAIAQVLELRGYIYSEKKERDQAIQFYTEAQAQYSKVGSPEVAQAGKLICERNTRSLASGQYILVKKPRYL